MDAIESRSAAGGSGHQLRTQSTRSADQNNQDGVWTWIRQIRASNSVQWMAVADLPKKSPCTMYGLSGSTEATFMANLKQYLSLVTGFPTKSLRRSKLGKNLISLSASKCRACRYGGTQTAERLILVVGPRKIRYGHLRNLRRVKVSTSKTVRKAGLFFYRSLWWDYGDESSKLAESRIFLQFVALWGQYKPLRHNIVFFRKTKPEKGLTQWNNLVLMCF